MSLLLLELAILFSGMSDVGPAPVGSSTAVGAVHGASSDASARLST